MLRQLAERKGLKVEQRNVGIEEIQKGEFSEIGACGTAVVMTLIRSITFKEKKITTPSTTFPVLSGLYEELTKIQRGELPDEFNWRHNIE